MTEEGPRGPFRAGERVQLTDRKGRRNTVTLVVGEQFHTHRGVLHYDRLIGVEDGSVVENSAGESYLALRPQLKDFVMSMPRGAAIVYPKDAARIVAEADIFPGATVVEAGVGSGALSLWLLRAIGAAGRLYSFERRQEFAQIARANARAFLGVEPANWRLHLGDLADELPLAVPRASVDRVVLDMLAPWRCLSSVTDALRPGGSVICYLATVTQLSRTAEAIRATGRYTPPESSETMVRGWHVEGLAVRPDHRMVAHTGFLITARRLADGTALPAPARRASKSAFSEEELEAWIPDGSSDDWAAPAVGERVTSDKRLRQAARRAGEAADARTADLGTERP